jgi:Cu/Zn superoxide dismutase
MMVSMSFYSQIAMMALAGLVITSIPVIEASETAQLHAQAIINGPQVYGSFSFDSRNNGTVFSGLINSGLNDNGNYSYHVHKLPVPSDGNCTATGGHLDPQNRNGTTCTSATLDQCEVGDLSGKFGKIEVHDNGARPALPFIFEDPTLSMSGENSIIGRSIVIHAPNGTRVGCGNIMEMAAISSKGDKSTSGANTASSSSTSKDDKNTNGATITSSSSTTGLLAITILVTTLVATTST